EPPAATPASSAASEVGGHTHSMPGSFQQPARGSSLTDRSESAPLTTMPSEQPDKSPKNKWVEIESYIQLGVLLPAATFVGWLIGHLLDLHFRTHWIYLVGL